MNQAQLLITENVLLLILCWRSLVWMWFLKTINLPVTSSMYRNLLKELSLINQVHDHMLANGVYPMFQSAFRPCHSTEMALVRVVNDILLAKNLRRVTLLVLLDLSAAFDTDNYEVRGTTETITYCCWYMRKGS